MEARRTLACALVQCHFDYAVASWYMGLSITNKKRLQIAQNKLARFILDLGPRSHIGQSELDQIKTLNTRDRATQIILGHMFNIFHKKAPSYLIQSFSNIPHNYNTRRAERSFFLPRPRGVDITNFSFQGAKLWNDLPLSIKRIDTKDNFKKKLKLHLRSKSYEREARNFIFV